MAVGVRARLPFFLSLCVACHASGCRGPLQPLALSPHGHGGPLQSRGPSPIAPLWRSNAMSAPMVQRGCQSDTLRHSLVCAIPYPQADPYTRALAEASAAENEPRLMATPDGGV